MKWYIAIHIALPSFPFDNFHSDYILTQTTNFDMIAYYLWQNEIHVQT